MNCEQKRKLKTAAKDRKKVEQWSHWEQRRHHPNLQNTEEDSKLWLSCMLKCVDNKSKNRQMALF